MPYQIGPFLLEEHLGVLWDRDRIKLRSDRASAVLAVLAERALQGVGPVRHEELWHAAWRRRGIHVKKDSVYTAIHTLRTVLGEAAIESIYGAGIRLVLPVSRVDEKRDTTGSSLLLPGDPPRILVMPFRVLPIDDPVLADRVTEQVSALLVSHHHVVDHALAWLADRSCWDPAELGHRTGARFLVRGHLDTASIVPSATARIIEASSQRTVASATVSASDPTHADLSSAERLAPRIATRIHEQLSRLSTPPHDLRDFPRIEGPRLQLNHARICRFDRPQLLAARRDLRSFKVGRRLLGEARHHLALTYLYDFWSDPRRSRERTVRSALTAIDDGAEIDLSRVLAGAALSMHREHDRALAMIRNVDYEMANAHLLYWIASYTHLGGGHTSTAIDFLGRSLALVPEHDWSFQVFHTLAMCHASQGNWDSAVRFSSRSLEINPAFPDAQLWLAIAQAMRGQPEDAEQTLARLRQHVSLEAACGLRHGRGQAWEQPWHDGLRRLGIRV